MSCSFYGQNCYLLTCFGTIVIFKEELGSFIHEDINAFWPKSNAIKAVRDRYVRFQPHIDLESYRLSDRIGADVLQPKCNFATVLIEKESRFARIELSGLYLRTSFTPQILYAGSDDGGAEARFLIATEEELFRYARFVRSLHRQQMGGDLKTCRLKSQFEFSIENNTSTTNTILDGSFATDHHYEFAGDRNNMSGTKLGPLANAWKHVPDHIFMEIVDPEISSGTPVELPLMLPNGSAYFYGRYFGGQLPPLGKTQERLIVHRMQDCLISLGRLSEGTIFSSDGVYQGFDFLKSICPQPAWLQSDGTRATFWPDIAAREAEPIGNVIVFYNGNLHNLYHWLIEGVMRLALMVHYIPPGFSLLLPEILREKFPIDHRAILTAVGLDKLPITWSSATIVHATEVLFWDGLEGIESLPTGLARDWSQSIRDTNRIPSPRPTRLLIIRRDIRAFDNEQELRKRLASWQFEPVILEDLPVADQIKLFQRAEFIVAAHGAGLSNIIFCRPGTRLLELMPDAETRPFFWLLAEKFGLKSAVLHCAMTTDSRDRNVFNGRLRVDLAKLEILYHLLLTK